jgi:hypothetical protein
MVHTSAMKKTAQHTHCCCLSGPCAVPNEEQVEIGPDPVAEGTDGQVKPPGDGKGQGEETRR